MLTSRQERFVFEYCKDFIASKAYVRAGYSETGAEQAASKLLSNLEVREAIEEQKEMLASVATLSPAWVLHQWMQIASANPNELTSIRRDSCPACYDSETRSALLAASLRDSLRVPNPECDQCGGKGVEDVFVADTRHLKGSAKRLYAGAVKTKDGIKILTRDQDAALANLSKYLGMVVERKELSGPGGGPVALAAASAKELTEEQLIMLASAGLAPKELSAGNLGVDVGVSQAGAVAITIDAMI